MLARQFFRSLALVWAQPPEYRGQGRALHAAPRMQRLVYQLPKPRPDGQTVLSLTPMEFEAYLPVLAGDLPYRCILGAPSRANPWPWVSDASRSCSGWRPSSRHHTGTVTAIMGFWPAPFCREPNGTALAALEKMYPRDRVRNASLRAAVTTRAGLPMDGPPDGSTLPAQAPTQEVTVKSRPPSTYLWTMLLARVYERQAQGWACLARRGGKSSRSSAPAVGSR